MCVCVGGGGHTFYGADPVGVRVAFFLFRALSSDQVMDFAPTCIDTLLEGVTS